MTKRNRYILLILSILVFIEGSHKFFTYERADIFIFYDYPNGGRYIANILYDFSYMISVSTVLFLWYKQSVKSTQRVILPFLFVSLLDIVDYILFYKQYSIIKLLVLIALIIIYNTRSKLYEKRNNIG